MVLGKVKALWARGLQLVRLFGTGDNYLISTRALRVGIAVDTSEVGPASSAPRPARPRGLRRARGPWPGSPRAGPRRHVAPPARPRRRPPVGRTAPRRRCCGGVGG